MLPNLPPDVVWVLGLPMWVMGTTIAAHLVIVNAALVLSEHSEPTDPTDGRYLYLVALLAHLAYLAGFLHATGYAFDVTLPRLGWLAVPGGLVMYAAETKVSDAVAGSGGGSPAAASVVLYQLPVLPIAVVEELFYRGVLFELRATHGPAWYVAASALLFGFAHVLDDLRVAASKALDGVVYAVAMVATGSVVVPVLLHLGYNLGYVFSVVEVSRRFR